YEEMQRGRNRPDYIMPETGSVVKADPNYTPPPRLSEAQQAARFQRGQDYVGNTILGATPVIGQRMAAKQAYEAGSDIPGALQRGDYSGAAGSAGLAAMGVAGVLPAA